jgi:membrane-bound lytic murein transglycosylase B
MSSQFLKLVFIFLFIFNLLLPNFKILAQDCNTPQECENLLKKLEEEIKKLEETIGKTEQEKKTLKNQIFLLKQKIEKLTLEIQQTNILIQDINRQIKDTETSIDSTSFKIEESRKKLAQILETIYKEDQKTFLEILLSEKTLSSFFDNLSALGNLTNKSQEILKNIKDLKNSLESQKQTLEEERDELENLVKIRNLQKEESEKTKKDQEYFLKITESQYQKYLKDKEATEKEAAKIRARIFELIGVPKAPTFGEAYELAKWIEKIIGVRPAFLLAVLTQESNIGKNVGQCFLKNSQTGTGTRANNGEKIERVMHPWRDVPYFMELTQELKRDPFNTLVSCPMSFGWGGAMGPAQFIPSTWAKYKERVKAITGSADPWNIKDAFVAAALYLADFGATKKTYDAEWKAAMIYFSGSANAKYSFYGNSVMAIALRYENEIKILEQGMTFLGPKLFSLNFHPLFLQYRENSF